MNRYLQLAIVAWLFSVSSFTLAQANLNAYALSLSQSMSAFYMYSLSEGENRYKQEFEKAFTQADQLLADIQSKDPKLGVQLSAQWQSLKPFLKYEFVEGAGYIIPVAVRNQYRSLLSDVYRLIKDDKQGGKTLQEQLEIAALRIEIMSARFFDVSSALYGTLSISNGDQVIDPAILAKQFKFSLGRLEKMAPQMAKDIRTVNSKWNFIEDSVINYKDRAAFLSVYYNKSKIVNLLNKNQSIIAGT